ncbi:uncharacterized protein EDB91DRAFT_1087469 [Suillus paluster]|uniref:uncharacterized protein n=1 Tax=Suillus paluster TaxID=48578 RepID=UPI001B87C26E|nr:uncharacterized protein EDB91DRAFT_1087469 [Suillus paluster]KAG1724458.1 hypothetical protein EDB91DRAFT_1087469 [Suillus paluster]
MMRSSQAGTVHTHLTTPPSSVGKSSYDPDSSDESPQIIVQPPPSSLPDPARAHDKKRCSRTVARPLLPALAGCLESGDNDMSLADIEEGKDILMDSLKRLSKKTITQAVAANEADCESKRMAVLGMAWVVEAKD